MFQGSIEATELFTRDTIVSARWLFFIISGRITQIIWHHMEFFLHIIYFLCSRRERQGLQGVLFRRMRGKKAVCMVRREGRVGVGAVEGFSGAVQARSAKICLMHSLNLGPVQASLKVTGEACTERSRRKKSCSCSPHATSFSLDSALLLLLLLSFWRNAVF